MRVNQRASDDFFWLPFGRVWTLVNEPLCKAVLLPMVLIAGMLPAGASVLERDGDHDGIPDARDRCPNTAQVKKVSADFKFAAAVDPERMKPGARSYPVDENGCELDSDGDGVKDSRDFCRDNKKEELVMGVADNGCPRQSDFDGTPDYRDRCPDTPRGGRTDRFGCAMTSMGNAE